jgi:hypothetical protein
LYTNFELLRSEHVSHAQVPAKLKKNINNFSEKKIVAIDRQNKFIEPGNDNILIFKNNF